MSWGTWLLIFNLCRSSSCEYTYINQPSRAFMPVLLHSSMRMYTKPSRLPERQLGSRDVLATEPKFWAGQQELGILKDLSFSEEHSLCSKPLSNRSNINMGCILKPINSSYLGRTSLLLRHDRTPVFGTSLLGKSVKRSWFVLHTRCHFPLQPQSSSNLGIVQLWRSIMYFYWQYDVSPFGARLASVSNSALERIGCISGSQDWEENETR